MSDPTENPYESPRAQSQQIKPANREVTAGTVIVTLVASSIAFVSTCLPMWIPALHLTLDRRRAEALNEPLPAGAAYSAFQMEIAWLCGVAAAIIVGRIVWFLLRRP